LEVKTSNHPSSSKDSSCKLNGAQAWPRSDTIQGQNMRRCHHSSSEDRLSECSSPLHANMNASIALATSNDALNLAVLRRYVPDVFSIISVAPYAVLYVFTPSTSSWDKLGIEGTLFITACVPGPDKPSGTECFKAIVLNRRGLDNFAAELLAPEDVDITEEYIIIKGIGNSESTEQAPEIYGLWVFAEPAPGSTSQMRDLTASIVVECATRAAMSRRLAEQWIIGDAESILPQNRETDGRDHSLSLHDLLDRQRVTDADFCLSNHHGIELSPRPEVDL